MNQERIDFITEAFSGPYTTIDRWCGIGEDEGVIHDACACMGCVNSVAYKHKVSKVEWREWIRLTQPEIEEGFIASEKYWAKFKIQRAAELAEETARREKRKTEKLKEDANGKVRRVYRISN